MQTNNRWEALDALRGLSVIGMLLNLNPGAWEHRFAWLDHADWHGWSLIDLVFPIFLFCVGAALPLSLGARIKKGADRQALIKHLLCRSFALIAMGVLLNAYPSFDWPHLRLPGILQRIGLCWGLVGTLLVLTSKADASQGLVIRARMIAAIAVSVLLFYWIFLAAVPVPGFGAPRFDSLGSWPPVIDRAVFGVDHMFIYGTTDGKVTYDPEGLLSTLPACFNVLAGVLAAYLLAQKKSSRPVAATLAAGLGLVVLGLLLDRYCPIVKKIWTSSFALLGSGFSLLLLAAFTGFLNRFKVSPLMFPLRVFGANALLAFIICSLMMPVMDANFIPSGPLKTSIRQSGYAALHAFISQPGHASFVYSLLVLGVIFLILWPLYQRRWFLKL
jgi:predicted acyltransferase